MFREFTFPFQHSSASGDDCSFDYDYSCDSSYYDINPDIHVCPTSPPLGSDSYSDAHCLLQ